MVNKMATCPVATEVSGFLRELFRALQAARVRYCVLHGWAELPETLASDLDLVVHPADRDCLPKILADVRALGYLPVQFRNYEVEGFRIDFAWQDGHTTRFAGVDFVFEYRYAGLILASADFLLSDREWDLRGFWIASPRVEFAYLLMKKTVKAVVSPAQQARLAFLLQQIGFAQALGLATELFGTGMGARVVDGCAAGRLADLISPLNRALRRRHFRRRPFDLVRYHIADVFRLCRRWLQPTGLAIVVLGPDGVGKNTLINNLAQTLQPGFRRVCLYHWRPGVVRRLKSAGLPVTKPHGRAPHGTFASVFSFLWFLLDFWLGYVWDIRPKLTRSALVMFNRYYPDLLVDSRRYRYGGPGWLPRVFAPLVPCHNRLTLVLDAPTETIRSRKRELAADEVERQRGRYLQLARELPHAQVVDASGPVEEAVTQASAAVLQYLTERFTTQHGAWLATAPESHVDLCKSA